MHVLFFPFTIIRSARHLNIYPSYDDGSQSYNDRIGVQNINPEFF